MLALALLILAQPLAPADAPSDSGPDIVYYGGKRVVFLARSEEVVLLDSAWVRYRGMEVHADSIHYDVQSHRLSASGDVLFSSASENIDGVLLQYDIDTRKGMMRTARTEVENGFFTAREVWLVEERVLNARGGSFTTCDREQPHYSFYGPRVKLYMDDAAYAQPVLFKVGRTPVLAAPFWIVPVSEKRKSGLLPFKLGFAADQGWFAKNLGYYLVVNDYSDISFYGDLMTKKGLQGRAEAIYDVSPFAAGGVTAAYIREWDTGLRRYSIIGDHTSRRFFFDTELTAKVDVMSDTSYVTEYTENRLEWLK
ncbi:MAG: putative LPS assembly protein LptD, partial [bacterium]